MNNIYNIADEKLEDVNVHNHHLSDDHSPNNNAMIDHGNYLTQNAIKALSIDNLVFGLHKGTLNLLLVKLRNGSWALPGGWVRYDESLDETANRLLRDLTGVKDIYLEQLKAFGKVDRFPRERVITIAFYALVRADQFSLVAGQTATDVMWQPVSQLPSLVFDHSEIVQEGLKVLRHQICHQPVGFNLLPEKFTLLELQTLYEGILGIKLDKPNFRRKILKMNLLTPCNEKQQGVPHRAASLYKFDVKIYHALTESGFAFEV